MPTLLSIFPDPKDLLALEPEDLAAVLIEIIPGVSQSAGFTIGALLQFPAGSSGYPPGSSHQIAMALGEAISWLITQGLIMQNPTQPATWYILTRRGTALKSRSDVEAFKKGRVLPLELLQPKLAEKVRTLFLRGDHDIAVVQAFKEVEVAVRKAGDYPDDLVGVPLMREAFHPTRGKLTDKSLVPAEREAEAALFAGAIGLGKNPGSHRDVIISPQDAARLIIFASYLLDLVTRRSA